MQLKQRYEIIPSPLSPSYTQVELRLISLKSSRFLSERHRVNSIKSQKQLPRGILKKKCSANLQENIHAEVWQLYWNYTSAWVFSSKFVAYLIPFPSNTSQWLLLKSVLFSKFCFKVPEELKMFTLKYLGKS